MRQNEENMGEGMEQPIQPLQATDYKEFDWVTGLKRGVTPI